MPAFEYAFISPERHVDAAAVRAASVDDALRAVDAALAQSRFAAKERADLAALASATGESYAQPELVPDALFERVRREHALAALVLSPGGGWALSVVLLYDGKGAPKGLPDNERATRLTAACGVPAKVRGPCYVARLRLGVDGEVVAGDFAPAEIVSREFLEQAMRANSSPRAEGPLHGAVEAALGLRLQGLAGAPACDGAQGSGAGAAPSGPAAADAVMRWADSGAEVVVTCFLPAHTAKGDVQVALRADSLALRVRTLPEGAQTVVEGRLFQRIDLVESNWTLESAAAGALTRALVVTLAKEKQMRWLTLTRSA